MDGAQTAVKLDPNDGKAHLALGEAYSFHGKSEQAFGSLTGPDTCALRRDLLLSIVGDLVFRLNGSGSKPSGATHDAEPSLSRLYNQGLSTVFFSGNNTIGW